MEYSDSFINVLWECVTIIEAQEQLKVLTAMDFPSMKKSQRQKLHRELYRQAYPNALKAKNKITPDDFAKMLGGGNG